MADTVREYGKALYELSCEEGLESEFLGELRVVSGIIAENPGFITLLSAPNIPKSERMQAIDNAFSGRIHEYICSFMKLMTKRGHSQYILPCFREYERLWYEYSGIAVADVTTAVPLTPEEKNALHAKLERTTGKSIEMRCHVDPALIAGVSVTVDGVLLEGSVKAKLGSLKNALYGRTL